MSKHCRAGPNCSSLVAFPSASFILIMSKGEGEHTGFSADVIGVGLLVGLSMVNSCTQNIF